MAEHNTPLIIMMIVSIALLFAAMVLSSMASSAAAEDCKTDAAHKYSMYTAIICGVASLCVAIGLGIYIYRDDIASGTSDLLVSASKKLKPE
jgi:NADH:ubiquinone oxidoreductase subunit K